MKIMPDKRSLLKRIQFFGGFNVIKFITRYEPKAIMYHRFSMAPEAGKVSVDEFDRQMSELRSAFNVLSMSAACDHLLNGRKLPANTIVLTIDDGYSDFYTIAYPILKRYGLPATLYITTDFIDGKCWLWPDIVSYIIDNTNLDVIQTETEFTGKISFSLRTRAERSAAWHNIINLCISVENGHRKQLIQSVLDNVEISLPAVPVAEYAPLTWEQLGDMAQHNIDIGAHTLSHPILSRLEPNEIDREIFGSKRRIEERISYTVCSFCYPNGQPQDINQYVKDAVANAGYTNASVAFYDHRSWEDIYAIRRYSGGNNYYRFKKIIHGSQLLGSRIKYLKSTIINDNHK